MVDVSKDVQIKPIVVEQKEKPTYCISIKEDKEPNEEGEWYSNVL